MSACLARRPDSLFWVTGALKKPSHICLIAQLLVVPGHFVLAEKWHKETMSHFHDGLSCLRETLRQLGFKRRQFAHPCKLSSTQQMCWLVRIPPHPCVKGNSTASRREKSSQDEGCGFNSAFVCFSCLVPRCAISCAKKEHSWRSLLCLSSHLQKQSAWARVPVRLLASRRA